MKEVDQAIAETRANLGQMLAVRSEIDEKIIDYRAMLTVLTNVKNAADKRTIEESQTAKKVAEPQESAAVTAARAELDRDVADARHTLKAD